MSSPLLTSPLQQQQSIDSDHYSPHSDHDRTGDSVVETSRILKQQNKRKKRERFHYIGSLSHVYYLYLKLMMGRELEDTEDEELLQYLGQTNLSVVRTMKKSFEYVNEFDYHMGDVVLTYRVYIFRFPNPDSEDQSGTGKISAMEAITLCMNSFNLKNSGSDFQVMDNLIFLKAIEASIFMLERLYNDNEAPIEDKDSDDEQLIKKGGRQLARSGGENDKLAMAALRIDNKLRNITSSVKGNRMQAIKEVFNLDYERLNRKGEANYKVTKGEYFKYDETNKLWKRTRNDTKDFSTLVRLVTMIQLTKAGFNSRQFLSKDGNIIYVVLYQCDQNLKIVAQGHQISKQLNFQFSDLLSLEPVDRNLRPLRLNNRLWRDPEEYPELSETFLYLKPKIIELLNQIKFKNIARELNLSQLNYQLFSKEGSEDIIEEDQGPPDSVWLAYYSYLMYLKYRVEDLRDEYKIQSDLALIINGTKLPLELYRERYPDDNELENLLQESDFVILAELQREEQIESSIALEGRPPDIHRVLKGIFKIMLEQRDIQNKYGLIKSYLHVPSHKQVSSKQIKVCKREKLAFQYLHLLKDALEVTNYLDKQLNTIWEFIGVEPFEPYIPYTITPNNIAYSQQNKMNSIWKKYRVSETGRISLFSPMERLKLNNLVLSERVNFSILFSRDLAIAAFCLNDDFELHGKSHKTYFDPIFEDDYDLEILLNENKYNYLHRQMRECQRMEIKGPNKYQLSEYEYVTPKLENLASIWKFDQKKPWFIPTEQIRDYYGEKIALYFTFLGYYTEMLLPIGIAGLIVSIIQLFVWDQFEYNYVMPQIVFGMLQIQWANLMFDFWQQREKVFAVKYGQEQGGSGEAAQQRSDFVGSYERSIENDNLNTLNYSDIKKFMRILFTIMIQFCILGVYVGVIIGIFFLSAKLQENETLKKITGGDVVQFSVTIPAFINLVVILILDPFFDSMAAMLTDYENHKTVTDYETNFVFKKYFLSFFAVCGPVIEIMFGHKKVGLKCVDDDCLKHAQYHFSSIFLLQFTLNIWEIAKPKLTILYRQYMDKRDEPEKEKKETQQIDEQLEYYNQPKNDDIISRNSQNNPDQVDEVVQVRKTLTNENPFEKINNFIENEFLFKDSYVISPERYGTVDDYMEITLQYSMLVLFGTTFPLCYFVAFLWNVLELQTDKLKLLNDMQRPLPLGESTIGVWNGVLEGLAYFSLVSNSGLIAFSRERIQNYDEAIGVLGFFLIILLVNFFLRFVEGSIFGEVPYEIQNLVQRHQYLIKSTIDKFRGAVEKSDSSNKQQKDIKRYPLHKVYGCLLTEPSTNKYEELSSDSDVEDHMQPLIKQPKKKATSVTKSVAASHMSGSLDESLTLKKSHRKNSSMSSTNKSAQKIKVKKKKSSEPETQVKKKESVDQLKKYFARRPSNWALKFKLKDFQDPETQQRMKAFYLRTLKFLKMLNELSHHSKLWTDNRFTYRKCFLRRNLVLIRNLDWRRTLVFKENQKKLTHILREMQNIKYKKQLMILNQNLDIDSNRIEKEEILRKIDEYVQKHQWLDGRKTVVFKVNGVWFHSFRKASLKLSAMRIAMDYLQLVQQYKQTFNEKSIKLETQGQLIHVEHLSQTKIAEFKKKDYFDLLDSIKIYPKSNLLYPLTSKGISQLEQELDTYISLDLRKQLNILNLTFIPCRIQTPQSSSLQYFIWNLFVEQQITKDQPILHIINSLDTKKTLRTASLEYNVFASKQQLFRWLVSQNPKPKLQDVQILYLTEILYHRVLHRDIINRVARFYEKITDIKYMDLTLKFPIAPLKYLRITNENQIINVRDPVVKGYLTRAYGSPKGYAFCNGKSLKEVLASRANYYSDQEICEFISSVLETLSFAETEQGMYHGNLNLSTIMLIRNQTPNDVWFTFSLVDFGMFYWYDFVEEKQYFTRAIEQNDELWYLSPELISNYLNPKAQIPISPQKCDAYSLGMVGLQMATLGKMGIEIEKSLKEQEGDVEKAVKRWIVNSKQQLSMKYPNTMNMVLQLINPDQTQRLFPSQMYAKHKTISQFKEQDIRTNFDEMLYHQTKMNAAPKISKDQMVRIFDGRTNQLNINVKDKITLQEYLKVSIYKFELHLKLNQLQQLHDEITSFEENMLDQFFYQLPYAKETGDMLTCIENYCQNQVYDILRNNIHEFKYLILYLLCKVQLLILQQNYRHSLQLSNKAADIVKDVEVSCVHLLHDVTKTEAQRQQIQDIHLQYANREQLYELQVSKDQLIKSCKEDKNTLKLVKALPQKLKLYANFFRICQIQIYRLQGQLQQAADIAEEYMIDTQNEIMYDVKHSKKSQTGLFVIKEDIIVKMLTRMKIYALRVLILFDSWRDADFQIVHDMLNEMNILHSHIKVDDENLDVIDKRRSSLTKQQLQNTEIKIKEDFQRSLDHTLQHLYRQGKFLQIMQLNRSKDNQAIKKRLRPYSKHFVHSNCLLNLWHLIPQLGWAGEYYVEIGDETNVLSLFRVVCDIMEECFFVSESFGLKTQIFMNYLRTTLAHLVMHCSQLLYYNPLSISQGIFDGFMQLVKEQSQSSTSDLLNSIMAVKILHVLVHLQNQQYPYAMKDETLNIGNITGQVLEQSLITQLYHYYEPLIPFFYEEYHSKKYLDSWLHNIFIQPILTELMQGYFYITSKQILESKHDDHLDTYLKSMEAKHVQQEMACNKNGFMVIEHQLVRSRMCLLTHLFQRTLPSITNSALVQVAEEFVLQSDTKQLIQLILLSQIDYLITAGYQQGIRFKKTINSKDMNYVKSHQYFDVKFVVLKILDMNLKNQQIEFSSELLQFTLMLFENKSQLFRSTHPSFFQTLQIYNVRIFALSEEIRLNITKEEKSDERQIEDLFEQVQKAQVYTKRQNNYLEVSKLLLSQSLEQNEMTLIKAALAQIDESSLENQVVLCQLGVKLMIYQMHTGQYTDADLTAKSVSSKLFHLIYSQLSKVAIRWQAEKQFQKSTITALKPEEFFKILKQQTQIYEKYEHNVLALLEPIKELFLSVREFRTLKQVVFLRTIFQYLEGLHTLAIMIKGDFKVAQANLSFIEKFGQQSSIEELVTLNSNITMNLDLITADYLKGVQKSQLMIQTIEDSQELLYSEIRIVEGERHYGKIIFDQFIEIKKPEQETLKPIIFSFDQKLIKTALRPYFEINRLKTEAYLCYLESSLNVQDRLTQIVDVMFAIQKYIQQQYGSNHIFNAHIQRLIAGMYAEFLTSTTLSVGDLEKQLTTNAEIKIEQFQNELNNRTRQYLEARVKNKCTAAMEQRFHETKAYILIKIEVLQGITEGLSVDMVCKWSLQAANAAYQIYRLFCAEYSYEYSPQLGYLYQTYSDIYFIQSKIVSTMKYLEEAKSALEFVQASIYNPDYCKLQFRQGFLRQNIMNMIKIYVDALMGLTLLTPSKKFEILTFILKEDRTYLQHFDNYKTHGFIRFLEQNLAKQLELDAMAGNRLPDLQRKDQKKLCQLLQVEGDKLAFQQTIDSKAKVATHTIELIIKDGIETLQKEKIKMDYSGEEYFQKAYQICKGLLPVDNPLCQKLEYFAIKQKSKAKRRTSTT